MLKDEEGGDFKKLKWQLKQKSGKYPQKRWCHSGIVLNNYLYIYGGKAEVEELREPVYRINCDTCECQTMDSAGMPQIRESHSCSVINNAFYLWGGCLNSTQRVLNDWVELKLHGKYIQWKNLEQKNQIQARESHSSLVLDQKNIMIFGGCGSSGEDQVEQYFSDFWIYNLQTSLWNQITKINGKIDIRQGCSLNFIKNEIYLFGGGGVQDDVYYNDLFKLTFQHTNFNDWSNFPELKIQKVEINGIKPIARSSHASVEYKNRYIIIIGGEGVVSHRKSLLGDVWCYDTQSRTWQELLIQNRSSFKPRANFSASLYKNSIFIFGGLTSFQRQLFVCSNQLFELCLNSSKSPPKLQSKTYICNVCKFQMKQKSHNHNNHIKHKVFEQSKPENTFFTSFSLISKVATAITHPIQALSLIIGSMSYLSASLQKKCKIEYLTAENKSSQIQITPQPVLRIRLQGLSLNKHSFAILSQSYEYIPIQSISFQKLSYHSTENQQKLWKYFSFNLKNACSRLGNEFLLGFLSSEGIISLVLCNKMGIYQTNISEKNLIEQQFQTKMHTKIIKQYMSHHSIQINDFKTGEISIHVSSLIKTHNSQKYQLELNVDEYDFTYCSMNADNSQCYLSLRKYLKYYFLEQVNLKVEIQKKPVFLLSLDKQLKKWREIDHSGQIQEGKLKYEEDTPGNIKIYHRNRCFGEIVRFQGVQGYISLRNQEQQSITSTKMSDPQKLIHSMSEIVNQFLELKRKRDPSSSVIELEQSLK